MSAAMLTPDAARVDGVAVAGVVVPRPRHVVDQRVGRHVLDEREHVGDRDALLVGDREQRQRAVAHQRGRDAVLRLRVARRVPEHLRVEVRVEVDEAGGDDGAGGVELGFAVGGEARRRSRRCGRRAPGRRPCDAGTAGAVDDGAAADEEITCMGCHGKRMAHGSGNRPVSGQNALGRREVEGDDVLWPGGRATSSCGPRTTIGRRCGGTGRDTRRTPPIQRCSAWSWRSSLMYMRATAASGSPSCSR